MAPEAKASSSCTRCYERKVKCDRRTPCGACVKHNVECVVSPRKQRRRRFKTAKQDTLPPAAKGIPGSTDLQIHTQPTISSRSDGCEVSLCSSTLQLPSPGPPSIETERRSQSKAQLLRGSGRAAFVDNHLWTRVAEELHDSAESPHGSSQEVDEDTSDDEQSFAFGCFVGSSFQPQHPRHEVIIELWTNFKRNVDPLLKVVHVPSFEPALMKAASSLETLPRAFEALMFAIYSIAVLSMRVDDCERLLGESRERTLRRLLSGTRLALSRAKFMNTTSLLVLQALLLYIFAVRDRVDARLVFTLNGIALRIAHSMGVHRDGSSLGLPPFETEIRRRIWWQMKMHDWKTAELAGLSRFDVVEWQPDTPKLPANINDSEIYPSMKEVPVETGKATDMMFCVLRAEVGSSLNKQASQILQKRGYNPNWEGVWASQTHDESERTVQQLQEHIEMKYIRFCDPTEPLHLMTMIVARSTFDTYRFYTHHPRRWGSEEVTTGAEQKMIWEACLRLLTKMNVVQSSPHMECFYWHTPYYMHWHPLIHVLDTLRSTPLHPEAKKAWEIVESLYTNNRHTTYDVKKPIHIAVGSLVVKAFNSKHAALSAAGQTNIRVPEFITELRDQYEKLQAQKTIRIQGKRRALQRQKELQPMRDVTGTKTDHYTLPESNSFDEADAMAQPEQPATSIADDSFWFAQSIDDNLFHMTNGTMTVDPILMSTSNSVDQELDWAQWDTLLSKASF